MSAYSKNNLGRHRRSLRRAMLQAVTPGDISEIMKLQVFLALKGDPMAVREVLDRVIGRAASATEIVEVTQANADMTRLVPADDEAAAMDSTIPALRDEREGAA